MITKKIPKEKKIKDRRCMGKCVHLKKRACVFAVISAAISLPSIDIKPKTIRNTPLPIVVEFWIIGISLIF